MNTTETAGKLCLYRDADSNDLIRCDRPDPDSCVSVEGFLSINNDTVYSVKFYSHDRCDDGDIVEDCPPGQRRSFDAPCHSYKAYDTGG